MAITKGTAGSFPIDFGVSEWLSGVLGKQVGAYNPAQHAPTIGQETIQNYPGVTPAYSNTPIQGPPSQVQYNQQTGGQAQPTRGQAQPTSGGGSSAPSGDNNPPAPSPVDQLLAEAQAKFDSIMGVANEAQGKLEAAQPGIQQGITDVANQNTQLATTNRNQGDRAIQANQGSVQKRFMNALAEARQALAETQIGGNQRFGRGSAIGRALGEYSTVNFQKASGNLRDTYEGSMSRLSEQKQQLDESFTNTMTQINTWKDEAMRQAQREFQDQMLKISSIKGEAAGNLHGDRLSILQNLKDKIDNINFTAYSYAQQAKNSYITQAQPLAQQAKSLTQYGVNAENLGIANASNNQALASQYSHAGLLGGGISAPQATQAPIQYTGAINRDEDQLYGALA